MTTRETWIALAERCQEATGPDREIDGAIFDAMRFDPSVCLEYMAKDNILRLEGLPAYTGSIDAITALIERELPASSWLLHKVPTRNSTRATVELCIWHSRIFKSDAPTPALALCAAFCRAMAEKEKT